LWAAGFSAVALVGCSGSGGNDSETAGAGEISLPLTAQGASGVTYRLRNATFVIQDQYAEEAGAGSGHDTIVVSSETNPDAPAISVSVPQGYYTVHLQPGWYLEKLGPSGAQTVQATLLSSNPQSFYVYRQSSYYALFKFGIGGSEFWLNGKVNIYIEVEEAAGAAGVAGASSGGGSSVGGSGGSGGRGGSGGSTLAGAGGEAGF